MSKVLVYVLRRDLRLADNPIFTDIHTSFNQSHHPYTHLLPIYVFAANQIEISGFLSPSVHKSPYPEARSDVCGFWRCGKHRAKFLTESVFDLKESLEEVGSGLCIRVGMLVDVVENLLNVWKAEPNRDLRVHGIWMTSEEGIEEKREERQVRQVADRHDVEFKLWKDEKYFVHDDDLPLKGAHELPNVFTSFKNELGTLRDVPRRALPRPDRLPQLPSSIPSQMEPFIMPGKLSEVIDLLQNPLIKDEQFEHLLKLSEKASSVHPFTGGESHGHQRIKHLITSGSMTTYKDTRNGLLGEDFSTKLSAWLALGCITARQIHEYLLEFEDGLSELGNGTSGYGKGENKGTGWIRFELVWRDYFRLCTRKFGPRLFRVGGFKANESYKWKDGQKDQDVRKQIQRFLEGTTGLGLIDASMREVYLTGYTSNRARQNVASFLAKHLGIDWRIGAEWYEYLLVDYDVSSNWGNWQYCAGVGNDPREGRSFNPVKQAHDYDPQATYIKTWVPELEAVGEPALAFQPYNLSETEKKDMGLEGSLMVEQPLKRITYHVGKGGRGRGKFLGKRRGK